MGQLPMFNLPDLQAQLNHKVLSAKELAAKGEKEQPPRPMSKEECDIFDNIQKEIGQLREQIATVEADQRRRTELAKLTAELDAPRGPSFTPGQPNANGEAKAEITSTIKVPASARRAAPLRAFKARNGESGAEVELRAYRAGMWAMANIFGRESARQWCIRNGMDIRNAMGTTSNPDGGFLVPDEFSRTIIDLREEYGVFRRNCRVWAMGSDTLLIPRRLTGVTIALLGENPSSAFSQSTPTFNQVQLVAKKFGGLSLISSEIAEDAVIDVADWIAQEFAYGFANFEDTAGFTGDGTSTYGGITGLTNLFPTTQAGAVQAASTHDTFAEIDATDLTTLMGKCPLYARANAKWYCSSVAADLVFSRLAASAGGNNTQTLRDGLGLSYLGYPIVISQVLPNSTGTINLTPMLFFGDLSKSSSMGDRRSISVFASRDRYMDTDQIGIRGIERIDIVNHDVGDTSTAGPLVCLLGKT